MSLRPDQITQALEAIPKLSLFKSITADQQTALVASLEFRSLVAGKVILLEQEISKTLYLLTQGSVGIWRRKNNQKERIALLQAPDFFGEISMFSDRPATALVKTEEPSHFFFLTRERFDVLVTRDAAFGELIRQNIQTLQRHPSPEQH